jgi:hypothetical protein
MTIVMTWPLVLYLNSHFAGQDIDIWINQWATWWTEKTISEGQSLYYTDLMFYPHGVSLAFHSFSHVNTALALLLRPWLGDLGAHNATVLIAHALSGYAMFCLARHITRSSLGAFFAGLVFAFYPYRMAESVHPVLVSTQWMPLYFLFLMRLVEEGRKRYAILAAVFFVLTALSSWHLMVFTILVSALYLGYLVVVERWRYSQDTVLNLVLLAGLVFVVIAPFLYPLVREQLTISRSYVGVEPSVGQGNDLVAFLFPAEQHPVLGKLIPVPAHVKNGRAVYLGVTVIGLSVAGSLANWKRARFWVLVALLSMLFSLGPHIQIGGHVFGVTTPWSKPITWLLRHPFRFNVLVGLALAVTSALGLSAVLRWLADNRSRWRWPFAGAMVALLVFEYLCLPFPTTAANVPAPYFDLATSPGEGAILGLPMGRQPSKYYLHYQMVHGRPLVEGVVSRTSQEAYALIEATPTLRSLRACGSFSLPPADLSPVLNALGEQGIAYVILHKKRLVMRQSLDLWSDLNTVAPDNEDEYVAVYNTQTESPRLPGAAQLLEDCVAVRPLLTGPALALQGKVLEIPLEWIIGNHPQQDYILELALVDEMGATRRRHQYEVVPGASLTAWYMGKRHATSYPFYVDAVISPGSYRLQATLVPVQRNRKTLLTAHLLDIQVSASSRDFSPPARHKRVVNAAYGSDLRLLEYDLEIGGDAVYITLHWQSLRRMEVDYKFFVHLYDAESEALVAQVDTMPQDWTYPTTWWEAHKVVPDETMLSFEDIPPGTYRLGVGVYNPLTGERLAIANQPGHFVADEGRLFLSEEIVR